MSLGGPGHAEIVRRSLEAGAVNAVAFTLTPFYLWYRGIARCGVARTSICAFAEPLVATLFSLLVLKDAPRDAGAGRRRGAGAGRHRAFPRDPAIR